MLYRVTRSFYIGDSLHEFGTEFRSEDQEKIKELLEDGNIEVVETNGGSESTTPLVEQPQVSVSPDTPQTVNPVETTPEAPQVVQPVEVPTQETPVEAPVNPTQAEIEETLRASGLDSSSSESSNEVQIS